MVVVVQKEASRRNAPPNEFESNESSQPISADSVCHWFESNEMSQPNSMSLVATLALFVLCSGVTTQRAWPSLVVVSDMNDSGMTDPMRCLKSSTHQRNPLTARRAFAVAVVRSKGCTPSTRSSSAPASIHAPAATRLRHTESASHTCGAVRAKRQARRDSYEWDFSCCCS
jgi:hypothetical protein